MGRPTQACSLAEPCGSGGGTGFGLGSSRKKLMQATLDLVCRARHRYKQSVRGRRCRSYTARRVAIR